MSEKPKHKDKDRKRRGEEQESAKASKRAKRGRSSEEEEFKKKKKAENKEKKKKEKEEEGKDKKHKTGGTAAKRSDSSADGTAATKGGAAGAAAEQQSEKQADKKLKAWQDDELEVESGDEEATRLQTLSGVAARSLGQTTGEASGTKPSAAPANVDGAEDEDKAAAEATVNDEPDALDAFMADLVKTDQEKSAAKEDTAAATPAADAAEGAPAAPKAGGLGAGMGVVDASRVKSITLEEVEALMGVRRTEARGPAASLTAPSPPAEPAPAGSPAPAASPPAASASASPSAAPAGSPSSAGDATPVPGPASPAPANGVGGEEEEPDEAEEQFHAVFMAEMRRLRGEGDAAPTAEEFSAAAAFDGPRLGYVFKLGQLGLGYYRDVAQATAAVGVGAQVTPARGAAVVKKDRSTAEKAPDGNGEADADDEEDDVDNAEDSDEDEEAVEFDVLPPTLPAAAEVQPLPAPETLAVPERKAVLTKKNKRRRRREAKEAEAKEKEAVARLKAKEGFGDEAEQLMESDPDRSEQSSEEAQESYFDLVKRFTTKKTLPAVDHSSIDYAPFRKNIYIQVKEITSMREHEVDDLRRVQGDIHVRGKHCPRPIKSFLQCGLPEKLLKIIARREYEQPFPIQMQVIPALMCGRDVIGVAQTGSGKTLAYLLPTIRHVLDQPRLKDGDGPIAFCVAPTRELALQIQREAEVFCKAVGLTSVCAFGGGPMGEQLSALKKGSEILVGTPGRLIGVLTASGGKITNLRRVTLLVLDEADRMFDMGFEPQIGMFLQTTRPDKQVALFSATLPTHVEALARTVLKKPVEITVGERNTAAVNVTQFVEVLEENQKFYRLLQLLGEWNEHGSIIIFVHQQKDVDEMFTELLKYGYPPLALHGGHDQHDRDFTLQDFKDGVSNILIATSVAARGIDVKSVILVVNFKVPDHLEDYIHRIGRTGRAGKTGFAFTFIQPDEGEKAQDMLDALRQCGQEVPGKLKRLAEDHQAAVNTGQAKKGRRWGGFGGKGFKYDHSEKSQQQKDRQKAKADLLIGDASERQEEEEKFHDPWNEDKPMSKAAQEKKRKEEAKQAAPKAGGTQSSPSDTVAAAAAVAARMQADTARQSPGSALAPGVGSNPAEFIPATAFTGARPGMSFKMGPKGLGYYLDATPKPKAAPAPAAAASTGPLAITDVGMAWSSSAGAQPSSSSSTAKAAGGAEDKAAAMPPPNGFPAKASARGLAATRKTEQEIQEQAQRMAEETLKAKLEGERAEEVRETQLPALVAKLKEKLRKAEQEQVALAAASLTPPPPPPKALEPPKTPVMMALPLVPGVLKGPAQPDMVIKSVEQIQERLAQPRAATAAEAQQMAQMLMGNLGPVVAAGMHADEFEINDYPAICRQKISHKDPLLSIEEMTGAKLMVRGQHFADERKMPEGARKLYVEITGSTVVAVQKAKQEIRRMMEALAIRTLNIPGMTRAVMGTPGRYDPSAGI